MKNVLAFGDSNTWGLVPGSRCLLRYPRNTRWTGVLEDRCGSVHIIEEGLCGRTTAFEDEVRPGKNGVSALPEILENSPSLDAAIVMLGTNDCKTFFSLSADEIGEGLERCLDEIEKYVSPDRILLVSPIHLKEDVWKPEKDPDFGVESVGVCKNLKRVYKRIAKKRGTAFLAASDYAQSNDRDSEHLDAEGHRILSMVIHRKLREMQVV